MLDFEESIDEGKLISERNWNRMKGSLQQEGLREGVSSGRDKAFQEGFNQGFTEGFKAAYSLGYLNSLATTLKLKELGISAEPDIDITVLNNPHRGLCQMCPNTNGSVSKVQMSDKMEQFYNLPIRDIVSQQRTIVKDVVEETKPKMMNLLQSSNIDVDLSDLYL